MLREQNPSCESALKSWHKFALGTFICKFQTNSTCGTNGTTVEHRFNEGPRDWQNVFAIWRFFFIYLTMTRVKKLVRYTEDFVISRFHCAHAQPVLPLHIHHFEQLYPQFTLSMNISSHGKQSPRNRRKARWEDIVISSFPLVSLVAVSWISRNAPPKERLLTSELQSFLRIG